MEILDLVKRLPWVKQSDIAGEVTYTLAPSPIFWNIWRDNKQELKDAGIIVVKIAGQWSITRKEKSTTKIVHKKTSQQTSTIDVPAPEGKIYRNFQKAAIEFASKRNGTLIADEPGLGKTIESIGLINYLGNIKNALVIAPASLVINWQREFERWGTLPLTIGIVKKSKLPETDITIMSYEMATKLSGFVQSKNWDIVVFDESHYCKNPKSKRTTVLFGAAGKGGIKAKKYVLLTGTPILNRPAELWTTAKLLDPYGLGSSWMGFHSRYCSAYHNSYGWDVSGASNLEELQTRLRSTFMIRRTKAEVLGELPRKIRQVIELEPLTEEHRKLVRKQTASYEKFKITEAELKRLTKESDGSAQYTDAIKKLRADFEVEFSEMSTLRHDIGVAKTGQAIEFIENMLSETDKIVVFAHHRDVINTLRDYFEPICVSFFGGDSDTTKTNAVDSFQKDPKIRLFIGGIKAAGLGLTLTASSRCVFVEQDWTPSIITQCEDRLHRIGQQDTVYVQHLVFDDSLDSRLMKEIITKQEVIDLAIG